MCVCIYFCIYIYMYIIPYIYCGTFRLVIIFILMSCFGGCGYYRRRRMAAMQQGLSTSLSTSQSPRRVCTSRQRRHTPQPDVYAYTGPGADTVTDLHLPPPYTEVGVRMSMWVVCACVSNISECVTVFALVFMSLHTCVCHGCRFV